LDLAGVERRPFGRAAWARHQRQRLRGCGEGTPPPACATGNAFP